MRKLLLLIVYLFLVINLQAQKKPLDIDALISLQVIKEKYISPDGHWAVVYSEPYRGDSRVVIATTDGKYHKEFIRGYSPVLSQANNFIAFLVKPGYEIVKKLKLQGKKKSELPKDSAYIFFTDERKIVKFDSVYKILVPVRAGRDLALLRYYGDKKRKKIYQLIIYLTQSQSSVLVDSIEQADFAAKGSKLVFVKQKIDSVDTLHIVQVYDFDNKRFITLSREKGEIKEITISDDGKQLAYLFSNDTSQPQVYSLYIYDTAEKSLIKKVDSHTIGMPKGWVVSPNGEIYFSRSGNRLFLGIIPHPAHKPEDSIPDDEKVRLDIWSWTDSILMPAQLKNLEKAKKFSYSAIYDIKHDRLIRVQSNRYTHIEYFNHGDARYALERDPSPYLKQQSWDYPWWSDFYIIDLKDGSRTLAGRQIANGYLSPDGKYFVYYNHHDSLWYSFNRKTGKTVILTNNKKVRFYNEENDIPAPARPYGFGGFSQDSKLCFIYDKYDIWAVDPSGHSKPYILTGSYGRKHNIVFRVVDLDEDNDYIAADEILLRAFDKITKDAGFYSITDFSPQAQLTKLVMSAHYYSSPVKAKNAERLIWQKSNVRMYPDLWSSDKLFKHSVQLTHFVDQQNKYLWADVELVHWITTDGREEEGLLFKPENFDPHKKYPMIVYYYELYSDRLNRYFMPRPSRSVINPIHYASNGYIVFIPNIRYKVGFPGMSAYNYVVSGTLALLDRYPWIDRHHIGLQGQSWGGYETAFIITQTNLFAAAEAGAPVSNMTSAYGGIRWGSGMSRMFQYEKTQSRIGKNLWDGLPLYLYNSPVFYAPYIQTPLLIMHNDNDGAVPWYQGIELFVALRRLNKPVWLLNYNGEPHNLREKSPATVDLTQRMMQFFNYYLKEEPMPGWMRYGRPALEKE